MLVSPYGRQTVKQFGEAQRLELQIASIDTFPLSAEFLIYGSFDQAKEELMTPPWAKSTT